MCVDEHTLHIDALCPELTLIHVPRISVTQLTELEALGQGGFGSVRKALLNGNDRRGCVCIPVCVCSAVCVCVRGCV